MTRPHLHIVVPGLTPPSVNSYTRHGGGKHYKTEEAKAFQEAVVLFARQAMMRQTGPPKDDKKIQYEVMLVIFLGKGKRGDTDNFPKTVLDAVKDAGAIRSDAAIPDLIVRKRRDADNPRTEIWIREASVWEHPPTWDAKELGRRRAEKARSEA